jgi:hypothetical protein
MLKYIGTTELKRETIDANTYTLALEWNKLQPTYHVYWRLGNFRDSLIEIGLSDIDHSIENVSIVAVHNRQLSQDQLVDFQRFKGTPLKGVPICEWTWDKPSPSRIDEAGEFYVCIGESSISIRFGDEFELEEVIVAERVRFGVDANGYIRAIQAINLQSSEIANIKLAFPTIRADFISSK